MWRLILFFCLKSTLLSVFLCKQKQSIMSSKRLEISRKVRIFFECGSSCITSALGTNNQIQNDFKIGSWLNLKIGNNSQDDFRLVSAVTIENN